MICEAQAVLGSYATALVGMENASSSGHATTVVEWHRAGFRLYWKWLSRARQLGGRKPVSQEIRALIFRMAAENPTWGAPRMHGELLKLGFHLSQPTVSRWLRRAPRSPDVQALADVFTKSSPRHCGDGLLHGTHDHLWCPVLLLCYQP